MHGLREGHRNETAHPNAHPGLQGRNPPISPSEGTARSRARRPTPAAPARKAPCGLPRRSKLGDRLLNAVDAAVPSDEVEEQPAALHPPAPARVATIAKDAAVPSDVVEERPAALPPEDLGDRTLVAKAAAVPSDEVEEQPAAQPTAELVVLTLDVNVALPSDVAEEQPAAPEDQAPGSGT